jgi:hypothetical protein
MGFRSCSSTKLQRGKPAARQVSYFIAAHALRRYIFSSRQAFPEGWPLLFLNLLRTMLTELTTRLDEYRIRLDELRRYL